MTLAAVTPGAAADRSATVEPDAVERDAWRAAVAAIDLAGLDAAALGGLVLQGRHGPVRDALLARLAARHRIERLAAGSAEAAVHESLDIAATLDAGRAVRREDLFARLARLPDAALLVVGAERLPLLAADRLCRWLDARPKIPIIALDESLEADDEEAGFIESALGDRLALHVRVPDLSLATLAVLQAETDAADTARPRAVGGARADAADALIADLVRLSGALGIVSSRAPLAAVAATRAAASRDGRDDAHPDDAVLAARLVLAPRARQAPQGANESAAEDENEDVADTPPDTPPDEPSDAQTEPDAEAAPPPALDDVPPAETPPEPDASDDAPTPPAEEPLDALPDRLVAAVSAALPPNVLASLASQLGRRGSGGGRNGGRARRAERGRPVGVGRPRASDSGRRLDLVATLKAAAPWQRIRTAPTGTRLAVRPSDFRVRRYTQPNRTTTVFIVDASGSAAMHRIGEAKGALEAVLAECYVRRDRVALISFRGTQATLDLPPTRSLARARRALIGLPAGGGTPIATGLDLAASVLGDILRGGENAVGILMTDGRANVTRAGIGGRHEAQAEAEQAAANLAAVGARLLYVDTAPRPRPVSARLAAAMRARYLPLPSAAAERLPAMLAEQEAPRR